MKNKLIIGRYLPMRSIIHQFDFRAKLIFVFFPILLIFFCHSLGTYTWLFLFIILFIRLARIPFWFLIKGLTLIFFFLVFAFFMHVLFTDGGIVLFQWKFIAIESNGVMEGIYVSLKLIFIVMIATIMTLLTSPIDLADAFEKLFAPLGAIKIPVHQLGMMVSIAPGFIPTLMDELEKIILAQKSRGLEISSESLITRIRTFIPIMILSFILAFQRAEELAIAMEVGGRNIDIERTSYKLLHWQCKDTLTVLLLIPIATILFILKFSGV